MYYVLKIVTGFGQSDMVATNNFERICFVLIINFGDGFFSFAFGLLSAI